MSKIPRKHIVIDGKWSIPFSLIYFMLIILFLVCCAIGVKAQTNPVIQYPTNTSGFKTATINDVDATVSLLDSSFHALTGRHIFTSGSNPLIYYPLGPNGQPNYTKIDYYALWIAVDSLNAAVNRSVLNNWMLTGNTTIAGQFIGTLNALPFVIKTDNILSGVVNPNNGNTYLGFNSGIGVTGFNNVILGPSAGPLSNSFNSTINIGHGASSIVSNSFAIGADIVEGIFGFTHGNAYLLNTTTFGGDTIAYQQWVRANFGSGGGSGWSLTGNSGTNPAINHVGTLDSAALAFIVNGKVRYRISPNGSFIMGSQFGLNLTDNSTYGVNIIDSNVGIFMQSTNVNGMIQISPRYGIAFNQAGLTMSQGIFSLYAVPNKPVAATNTYGYGIAADSAKLVITASNGVESHITMNGNLSIPQFSTFNEIYPAYLGNTRTLTYTRQNKSGTYAFLADTIKDSNNIVNIQYVVPLTGNTIVANGANQLIVDPAGTLPSLNIDFPASPKNGQTFYISISQIINTLTLSGGSNTVKGSIVTISANAAGSWVYYTAKTTWYKRSN